MMQVLKQAGRFSVAVCVGAASAACTTPTPGLGEVARASSYSREEFTLFESGQVRPLALSADGTRLYAVNTPDNRLEIFDVTPSGLLPVTSVPVGLEPVAVAVTGEEVWVVNHLSDSVSVIAERGKRSRVVRTLLTGDEPRDIVFAGSGKRRAFITTAHRGQNIPFDPQLTTPGVGRADVWIFDADALDAAPTILTLFTDTPRALAATPDGSRVYAAGFHTGNQTTTATGLLLDPVTYPPPPFSAELAPRPNNSGLIVKWNGAHWVDEQGIARDDLIRFALPDRDVFVIDALATPPRQLDGAAGSFAHVGTVLFNMAVNPRSGKVYVSNLEANNARRFEGRGDFAGHSIRGHLAESRITVLEPGGVRPRHLNKHIDYDRCCAPLPNAENARSLAFPLEMAVSADGETLYVAALGSSKVGVFATAELEADTFVPDASRHIAIAGGGPTGLVLDDARRRLYVLTRFDNSIAVIDTTTRAEIAHVPLFNPEPAHIVEGRRFLYDAAHSSSHGDSACASCHVFGDLDSLAWDLGDPDGLAFAAPGPFVNPVRQPQSFHPMKGPMVTQSLRGMANHGPMHWRGDRTGGNDAPSVQPSSGAFDEEAAFAKFNPAFVGLLGRDQPLTDAEMRAYTKFVLELTYPPNPIRQLDNSLTDAEQRGRDFFFQNTSFQPDSLTCNACHVLDRDGNARFGVRKPGFFGSDGRSSDVPNSHTQLFKNPHLRNQYQKVGMFGFPLAPGLQPGDNGFQGDQVRGFGFLHDGSMDTLFRFLSAALFIEGPLSPGGFPPGAAGEGLRRDMEAFMFAFDSNLAPIVGQQMTLAPANTSDSAVHQRIDLLEARATAGECDLVVRGDEREGFLYAGNGAYLQNRNNRPPVAGAELRSRGATSALTWTCVPPGSGQRIARDRDLDGILDGDE